MTATVDVSINIDLIPSAEMRRFCRGINDAAEKFFEDPLNRADFEVWHAAYLAEKEACA